MSQIPKLTLIGAGPGDPDLITVKGAKILASADVILYDALVHPEVLQHAREDAVLIPVGKRAGKESVSQETILQLIRESAYNHGHVVRLKGGDPFVFARGFEELAYATEHGIETEVVPGISSVMLPGYYGIPLTVRGINQSFSVVTATTSEGTLSEDVFKAAECAPTTLFFMGLRKIAQIVEAYNEQGRGDLPVAIISNGSLPNAEVISATVGTILKEVEERKPAAPALLIFGEGAALAKTISLSSVNWQEKSIVA
jgi:uroporphyrin-III C-methyltransferase